MSLANAENERLRAALSSVQAVLTEVLDSHDQWDDDEEPETYPGSKARNELVRLWRKARSVLSTT